MPLHRFSPEKQAEIAWLVAQDEPPEKWLYLGSPDSRRPLAMIESRAWYEWYWQRGLKSGAERPPILPKLRRVTEEDLARDRKHMLIREAVQQRLQKSFIHVHVAVQQHHNVILRRTEARVRSASEAEILR